MKNLHLLIHQNLDYMKSSAGVDDEPGFLNSITDLLSGLSLKATICCWPDESTVKNIIDAAVYFIDKECSYDPLIKLNSKLLMISSAPYVALGHLIEEVKTEAHQLYGAFECPEQKAEAMLIVCKCHYFRSPNNFQSADFWEYATAWVNANIKHEWSLSIKTYFYPQLKTTSFQLIPGCTY